MKKTLAALALAGVMGLSGNATAVTLSQQDCSDLADAALMLMVMRQEGHDYMDIISAVDSDFGRAMVDLAFKQPRHYTKEAKLRAEQDFRNDVARVCMTKVEH